MKTIFTALVILLISTGIFIAARKYSQKTIPKVVQDNQIADQNIGAPIQNQPDISSQNTQSVSIFQPPLDRAKERVTKKPFGTYITPATSPVQPEKFQGFHTGTDFETFPEEADIDVPVKAVCSGKLLVKKYASGYGGIAVESCSLDNNPITVVYGHLKLSGISAKAGDNISAGEVIGILGKGYSAETDGERKHLHLGFHKGNAVNIRGYVASKPGLSDWIDPCLQICSN